MLGKGICEGIAIGKAWIAHREQLDFSGWPNQSIEAAKENFKSVKQQVMQLLQQRTEKAASKGIKAQAEIFEAHQMMLDDPELENGVYTAVKTGKNLPQAIETVLEQFAAIMEAIEDPYMQQRSQDYRDLNLQLLNTLAGREQSPQFEPGSSWILAGVDFSPSDIQLTEDPAVKGFVCEAGAPTTHFSILAKIAGIPTVLQVGNLLTTIKQGDLLVVDGKKGTVLVNPDAITVALYEKQMLEFQQFKRQLETLKNEKTITGDGISFKLEGNIAGPKDVAKIIEVGADGVGLFRTEFIYMDRETAPAEAEQEKIYREVLKGMDGRPVVIRTLDVGGDKELPYLGIPKEDNPFLGVRAVRYCLSNPELFKVQLRALLKASVEGELEIMVPMISCIEEVRSVKALLEVCKAELSQEGIAYRLDIKLGIMVEVPAAAVIADLLAQEVDFFSIGTNDLIQYMMATDRMNQTLGYLYTPYSPTLIRTLKAIIEGAHSAQIPVAMCGELAGDTDFAPILVGLGLDIWSMNGGSILKQRLRIRTLKQRDCIALVQSVINMKTEAEIKQAIAAFNEVNPYETA